MKPLIPVLALAIAWPLAGRLDAQEFSRDTVVVQNGALRLRALLWRPAGRGPFPAIIYNHGSGPQADPQRPEILGPVFARHGYAFLYMFRRGAGLSADQGTNSVALMNRALEKKGRDARNQLQLQLLETEMVRAFDLMMDPIKASAFNIMGPKYKLSWLLKALNSTYTLLNL